MLAPRNLVEAQYGPCAGSIGAPTSGAYGSVQISGLTEYEQPEIMQYRTHRPRHGA